MNSGRWRLGAAVCSTSAARGTRIGFISNERALMARYRVIRSWTTDEDEILIALLKQEHQPARALARKLHRTVNAVRRRALKLGLSATRAGRGKLAREAA
jgi:hypothetical protein